MTDPVSTSERDVHALLRIVTGEREDAPGMGCPGRPRRINEPARDRALGPGDNRETQT